MKIDFVNDFPENGSKLNIYSKASKSQSEYKEEFRLKGMLPANASFHLHTTACAQRRRCIANETLSMMNFRFRKLLLWFDRGKFASEARFKNSTCECFPSKAEAKFCNDGDEIAAYQRCWKMLQWLEDCWVFQSEKKRLCSECSREVKLSMNAQSRNPLYKKNFEKHGNSCWHPL